MEEKEYLRKKEKTTVMEPGELDLLFSWKKKLPTKMSKSKKV